MITTPKKLVHWEVDSPSFSNLDSPFFNTTQDSSIVLTSSLEFINAQLVAHGFLPSPGISLDGTSNDESARVVKCLLALLSQRVEDMSRTEDLATKVRTVSYDLERMASRQRTAAEKAANAEREMNLHKSRMTATLKSLQSSENAHKQTTAELQRTRTLLQGLRATHQAELKKKEKDIERITEKWQKVADTQAKLATMQSGIRCANVAVVEGMEVLGRGPGFLDIALEQAEQARLHLSNENLFLRKLMLRTVNEVQSILHQAQSSLSGDQILGEPSPLTMTTLFPLAPPTAASDKVDSITTTLREALTTLSEPKPPVPPPTIVEKSPPVPDGEVERLQGVVTKLKEELARSQKQSMAHMVETQAMFDKFAEDHRVATGEIGEISVELLSAPLRDEEKERLYILRNDLDTERQKFTEAAVKFGKEKAALEAERLRFLDEKRSWEVEKMLSDLPPTPIPVSSPHKSTTKRIRMSPKKAPHKSPHISPRKSPAKHISVGKAGSGRRAHRVSRRSSAGSPLKVVLSYETELIPPPVPAPAFPPMKCLGPPSSLLPTSFVLPPPSPRASLPTKPALPPAAPDSPPESNTPDTSPPSIPAQPVVIPSTPPAARRPFPVAKPFAARMIHAYSPAKPSPLSRILMLANSPVTPPNGFISDISLSPSSGPLEAVAEEPEDGGLGPAPPKPQQRPMSLAEELGVSESPPDTPLQEKNIEANVGAPMPRGRVFFPEPQARSKKPLTAAEKGKAKAEPASRARTSAVDEKENSLKPANAPSGRSGKVSPMPPASNGSGMVSGATRKVPPVGGVSKPAAKLVLKPPPASSTARGKPPPKLSMNGGGPRRVLINSADAPPIGKGWKG